MAKTSRRFCLISLKMDFLIQKKNFLSKPDKSGIGRIDKAIRPLLDRINRNDSFYTTSSCAGRIVLMKETGKKQENVFVFVSHDKVRKRDIQKALSKRFNEIIYLKAEPCILHVACKDAESAQKIVTLARQSGWKKSGIISLKEGKVMAELVSTEALSAPVYERTILVHDNYLDVLVKECNKKLTQTRGKITKLQRAFS